MSLFGDDDLREGKDEGKELGEECRSVVSPVADRCSGQPLWGEDSG